MKTILRLGKNRRFNRKLYNNSKSLQYAIYKPRDYYNNFGILCIKISYSVNKKQHRIKSFISPWQL